MSTEFLLATFQNLKCLIFMMSLGSFFASFMLIMTYFGDGSDNWKKTWSKKTLIASIVGSLFACIPDVNDLWKVRISLIKYELSSKENIQQAAETIERIGTKLECKYLGCEDNKK